MINFITGAAQTVAESSGIQKILSTGVISFSLSSFLNWMQPAVAIGGGIAGIISMACLAMYNNSRRKKTDMETKILEQRLKSGNVHDIDEVV